MLNLWDRLSFLQWAAAVSTLILTLGAVWEYEAKLKPLAKLGWRCLLFRASQFERCTFRKLLLHSAAPILVVLGIAGELVFETRSFIVENDLAAESEKQISQARLDAANANKLAKGYEAQIADSNARVKTAEAQVATAKADVSVAVARVAEADARSQEARSMAEAEKLERVRLEAIVAPRSLSVEQQRQIADACRRFSGHRVLVSSYGLDGEGAAIGAQIIAALRSVLGSDNVLDNRTSSVIAGGFEFGVHVRWPDSEREFGTVVANAFQSLGRLQTFVNQPRPRLGAMMSGGGTSFPTGTVFVDVMIGVKPVPIMPTR